MLKQTASGHIGRRALLAGSLATLAAPSLASGLIAQPRRFTDRPIRVIVPFAAGGGVDVYARMIADKLRQTHGYTIVIDNRAGANGSLGGSAVRTATPDGHTLLFSAATHVMARQVMRNAPYDPLGDFAPIARVGAAPMMLVMAPRLGPTTVAELIAEARKAPDKWSFGTAALGAPGHLATIAFNLAAGLDLMVVTYRGTAPALNDVAGGHVQLMIDPVLALLPMASANGVRGLAVTTAARTKLAPAYPTLAESGLAGFDHSSWYGLWGPQAMPGDAVAELNAAFNAAVRDLEGEGKLAPLGIEAVVETPDAFRGFMERYVGENAALLRAARFEPV